MPDFRPMSLEFRPPEIRFPEELRAPLLKKPEGVEPPKIAEEGWTPEQTHIAKILQDAFKGQDSLDSNILEEAVSRPIGELTLPKDVKINTESRTISYTDPTTNEIHEFGLPPALQINKDTKTITYTPPTFGATPAVLVAASRVGAKPQPPTSTRNFQNNPVFVEKPKPLTHAEEAQRAVVEQAAAAQKATVAKENDIVAKNRPSAGTKKPENASNKPNETPKPENSGTAGDILAAQKSMSQAIEGAINTQQNTNVKTQETQAATLAAGNQNVGTVVAAKGAENETNQQNQQGREQTEFQQKTEKEATTVGAATPGQGVPGKSKK